MPIAFRASSSGDLDGSGGLGGFTITKPAGTVGTDILIVTASAGGGSGLGAISITPPAGWTAISALVNQSDGTNRVELFGWWALGSVVGLTFTASGLTLMSMGWVCAAFSGVDATTPIDAVGATNSNTGSASLVTNAVTIATVAAWHCVLLADHKLGGFISPGSFSNAPNGTPPVYQSACLLYDPTPLPIGSTGTASVSTASGTNQILAAMPFALRPASVPPDPYAVVFALAPSTTGTASALPHFDDFGGVVNSVVGNGYVCITIDNGAIDTFATITGRVGFSYTPSEVWESSLDGITWSPFTATLAHSYTPGAGVYSEINQVWTPSAGSITTRFIRYTLEDAPTLGTQVATPGVIAQQASNPALIGGSFSLSGSLVDQQGSPYANCEVTIAYKTAAAPEIRTCHLQNPNSNGLYCADGDWATTQVTTDCSGNWTWAGLSNLRAVQVYMGPMRVNPAYDPESLVMTNGWPNWCYLIIDTTQPGWANATYNDFTFIHSASTGTLTSYHPGGSSASTFTDAMGNLSCCGGPHGNGAQILAGIRLYGVAGGYDSCGSFHFLNGAYTLNTVMDLFSRVVVFVAKAYGRYFDMTYALSTIGLGATIHDTCGRSGALVGSFFGEWRVPYDQDFWTLSSVTGVTFNAGFDCSHLAAILTLPPYDFNRGVEVYPVNNLHSPETPRIGGPELVILVEDCSSSPDLNLLSATEFDGALNVAWVSGGVPGALKTAVHMGAQKQIGSSTTGWRATQTIEASGVNGCGIVYMPEGRLVLVYDKGGKGVTRYNEALGTETASDWTAAAASKPHYFCASGIGQEQAFILVATGGGSASNLTFQQCRDGQGKAWTNPVIAVSAAVGPGCGGVWMGNEYGLLYNDGTKVRYLASGPNPDAWAAGPGVDTTFTGTVCGLAKHKNGRLVGVLQASPGGACSAIYSDDAGKTWTSVALSITSTPPPVIVSMGDVLYAIYIASDAPHFVASTDGGATWT